MKTKLTTLGLLLAAGILAGCGETSNPGTSEERDILKKKADAVLADFKNADPSLEAKMKSADSYVIFPEVTTAAIGVGGAHGDGVVYEKGKQIGWADLSQGSIGVQLGGQKYGELILFESESRLLDFTHGTFEFDAAASAIAASRGAATSANYAHGVMVFTLPQGGLMFQAAIGGQKFRYTPLKP